MNVFSTVLPENKMGDNRRRKKQREKPSKPKAARVSENRTLVFHRNTQIFSFFNIKIVIAQKNSTDWEAA